MQNWKLYKVGWLAAIIMLVGCKGDDIAVNTENNRLYEMVLPSIKYSYTLADALIDIDDNRLSVGDNDLIYFTVTEDASTHWGDLAAIDDIHMSWAYLVESPVSGHVQIPVQEKVQINSKDDVRFDDATFDQGNLMLTMSVPYGVTGTIIFTIPEFEPIVTGKMVFNGDVNQAGISISLEDRVVNFGHEANSSFITLIAHADFEFSGEVAGELGINFQFSDIKTKMLHGYFGQYETILTNLTNHIEKIDESAGFEKIEFREITYSLHTSNHIGVPFDVDVTNIRFNRIEDEIVEISKTLLIDGVSRINLTVDAALEGPPIQPANIFYEVSSENSNILEIGNPLPEKLIVDLVATSNPDGETEIVNFIGHTDSLYATLVMKAPMWLKINDFSRTDTLDFDFKKMMDQDRENAELIQKASIHIRFANKIPIDLSANLAVVDINGVRIDELLSGYEHLITGGELNSDGKIAEAIESKVVIELEKSQIENYFDNGAMYLVLESKTSSYNNENEYVQLFADSGLMISVSVEAIGNAPKIK